MFYGSSAPAAVYYYSTATRGTSAMEMRTTSYHLSFLAAGAAAGDVVTTVITLGFW